MCQRHAVQLAQQMQKHDVSCTSASRLMDRTVAVDTHTKTMDLSGACWVPPRSESAANDRQASTAAFATVHHL